MLSVPQRLRAAAHDLLNVWRRRPDHSAEGAKHPRSAKRGPLKADANSFGTSIQARVRLGLDLPSRQEVLTLADRIEALGLQLETLEKDRLADAEMVKTLRREVKKRKPAAKKTVAKNKAVKAQKKPARAARPKTKAKKKSS